MFYDFFRKFEVLLSTENENLDKAQIGNGFDVWLFPHYGLFNDRNIHYIHNKFK